MNSQRLKRRAWKKQRFKRGLGKCFYCGCLLIPQKATVDHFIPISSGGTNHPSNWRLSCWECNQAKADTIITPALSRATTQGEER